MSRISVYRTSGLCFLLFLLGVVVGGGLILSLHRPNHIHLSVMPYQGVNISPEPGDEIDWSAYGQDTAPSITFSEYTGSPCSSVSPKGLCVYNGTQDNIYSYTCSGSATCDPGMGPSSGTKGGSNSRLFDSPFLQAVTRQLYRIDLSIDRALGLFITPARPYEPPGFTAPGPLAGDGQQDAAVNCDSNNEIQIDAPNITKTVGQSIYWLGNPAVSITMDQTVCKGDMTTARALQSCVVVKPTTKPLAYTITDSACTAQPTLNTPTITTTAAPTPH